MRKSSRKKWKINLRSFFILLIFLEFVLISVVATVVSALLYHFLHPYLAVPEAVYSIFISIVLSGVVISVVSRRILYPVSRLIDAMKNVAGGDFSVRLNSECMINEIQELYNNFDLMVSELANTEILQTDFVSNVSHEFKTPINAIDGYAMLLQDENLEAEEQAEYAEKILFNTRRLSGLVGNILLLSKVENQAFPIKRESFRLDEQIRQTIISLEPKWEEKEIEFDMELDEVSFVGNEVLLMHIWLNIIDNAIKFSPPGGSVKVLLKESERNILVTVQDSGPGISEEERKRIFEKFYQAESSHKSEGNGLGLALVKRIAAMHQGHVEVENGTAGGCKMMVILPVRE